MNLLIVDDNKVITENIALYFVWKWHNADTAENGEEWFDMIQRKKYDFLIVDRMMPKIDGLAMIRMLQARNIRIPFLFLTALGKQVDKIEGLALWADDYLVKPFDLVELELRILNIIRRNNPEWILTNSSILFLWNLEIDLEWKSVKKNSLRIELAPKEYSLLELLLRNRGKVLDRDFLYEKVWWDFDVSQKVLETINVHVAHLRKKLGANLIRTVKLSGYIIDNQ